MAERNTTLADADLSVMPDFNRQENQANPWWRFVIRERSELFPNAELPYFARALRSVATARCLLVLGALGIEAYSVWVLRNSPQVLWPAGLAYALFSLCCLIAAFTIPKRRVLQAGIGLGVDWIASIALFGFVGAVTSGSAGGSPAPGNALMLVWPVLQAGVLGSGYLALMVALAQACYLSVQATVYAAGIVSGESVSVLYAVLVSAALVTIGWLSQQLASRLNTQETERAAAEQRARRLEAVNRLSLAELDDGVFVADVNGRVETANPAALRMLGLSDRALPTPLLSRADLTPVAEAFAKALQTGSELDQRVSWKRRGVEHVALVQCRVTKAEGQDAVVVFMRDAVRIDRQVHDAKLAAMGRLVAGIAHDIRNPLSAITQAGQLLREQHREAAPNASNANAVPGPGERLAGMILTHAERINDTIEDVLVLGRKPRDAAGLIELGVWLQDWAEEQHALGRATALELRLDNAAPIQSSLFASEIPKVDASELVKIRFHSDHLRRIVNNLFDNALRYCSGAVGSIVIMLNRSTDQSTLELVVANDGPVIEEPLRSQLFEPFMSGESRGTGLGLYICRELCQQNGAALQYRIMPQTRDWGAFVILLPLSAITHS